MIATLVLFATVGVLLIALGRRIGRVAFLVAAVAPVVSVLWVCSKLGYVIDGRVVTEHASWVPDLGLSLDFRLDAMAATMTLIVSGIGVLTLLYSRQYFAADTPDLARLAGLLVLFAGAMVGLVQADHLIVLYTCWELTSVTSYLLIGNRYTDAEARAAALQALLVTGAGGLAMLGGFVLLGQSAGTYLLSELAASAPTSGPTVTVALVLILLGRLHQIGAVSVSLVVAGGDGCAHTGQRVFALGGDGDGRRLSRRPFGAHLRDGGGMAAVRARRGSRHDARWWATRVAPARSETVARLRHGESARVHDGVVRRRHSGDDHRRLGAPRRARDVQGRAVHGGRNPRSLYRHTRYPRVAPARPTLALGRSHRGHQHGIDDRVAARGGFHREGGRLRSARGPTVRRKWIGTGRYRARLDAHRRVRPAFLVGGVRRSPPSREVRSDHRRNSACDAGMVVRRARARACPRKHRARCRAVRR